MAKSEQVQKIFIFGALILTVFCIMGIVWAVSSSGKERIINYQFLDENAPSKGATDAKVTVRIFSDFQCPACSVAEEGVKYAMEKYGDKVKFLWNDFPLVSIHDKSMLAAIAARCAENQGKFWEYHDKIFDAQEDWVVNSEAILKFNEYAEQLSLNVPAFSSCLSLRQNLKKITDDQAEARSLGLQATPTFFINNKKREGVLTAEEWDLELKSALGL